MEEWHLSTRDLKKYPHFDSPINATDAEKYATNEESVARHTFYPFMRFRKRWTRFAPRGEQPTEKVRPLRYAARRDAYIYSRYRHLLSARYEAELSRLGLDRCVLAYRRIPTADGKCGKCNIQFAHDAFVKIRGLGNCCVIALDISSYFESLDHSQLKTRWCRILGVNRLPDDHFSVFKAITQYSEVSKESAYGRLGHFGWKLNRAGAPIMGYLTPFARMPKQLCTGKEFRERIAGGGSLHPIIEKHSKSYGIPQGAPISDLLANLYLIDFDREVLDWVIGTGGAYYRYSDDILIVAPGGADEGRDLMERTQNLIQKFGPQLKIKKEKSSLLVFKQSGVNQSFQHVHGVQGKSGLEYLGFRYDGRKAYLRNSTISNLLRKITRAAYREAESCARRYADKNVDELKARFDYENLIKKFGRVEAFSDHAQEPQKWTFWTYTKKASVEFGPLGTPILRQLRRHRQLIRERADHALERAVIRRERRKLYSARSRKGLIPGVTQTVFAEG